MDRRPLIGGTFANAATRYPKYFSWPVFVDHPYLPPCLISAVCTLLVMGLAYLLIEEVCVREKGVEITCADPCTLVLTDTAK